MGHQTRSGRRAVGEVGRSAAAGGAVVLIAALLLSACSGGGSPEGVVRGFLDAIGEEDVLGATERVLPSEHRFIIEPLLESLDEAERLGIVSGVDLEQLQGIDIEFEGLSFEAEELADDLVWVAVSGEFSSTVRPDDLPLGSLLTHFLPEDWADDIDTSTDGLSPIGEDFGLAVVREEGRWRISLLHTIAEAARREAGEPYPTEQPFPEPAGAESAEDALEQAALAAFELDLRGFVGVLVPGETAAFRRYAQLFIEEWDEAVADARTGMADAGFSYSIDGIVAGSAIGEDDTVAWIEDVPRFEFVLDVPDMGVVTVDRDGECLTVDIPESLLELIVAAQAQGEIDFDFSQFDGEQCVDLDTPADESADNPFEGQEELFYEFPIFGPLFERWAESGASLGEAGASAIQFEVQEIDGRWFVSLAGTMNRWVHALTSTLDEELLTEVGDQLREAIEDPETMDLLMQEWLTEVTEAGLFGPMGDPLGKPYIGPELLAPYADRTNVLLVWEVDAAYVAAQIEALHGRGIVVETIDGPDLYDIFLNVYGLAGTAGLTPDRFPAGIVIAPLDLDALVEIVNWTEIVDMFLAAELGLDSEALVSVFELAVGDCFDDPNFDTDEIVEVPGVPCPNPHDNEVFFVFSMTETTYPGLEASLDAAYDRCIEEFDGYVGIDYLVSDFDVWAVVPTQGLWDGGERAVVCALYALDFSKLTGSMEGAAR
ncbi:MAG TPA: septum formation family protein [Acidimicrobiia bacterium]|nr:septum formation family protein [Acidimicrobiia bacterium]